MYKEMRSRVGVGDEYSNSFDVRVNVHQGSVFSPLLFVIVLEALSLEFLTSCPSEILYVEDLMVNVQFMDELLAKTWRSKMENKGLRVNMSKNKLIVSGSNFDVLKISGKYPCSVCQTGVGKKAIYCGSCRQWVHNKCSGIKGS